MLLSAMSVLVVAQSSSEIPEGLMNNPVYKSHISSLCRILSDESRDACDLEFGHPPCVCNNEVEYNEGQNTTKFIDQ